MIITGCEKFSAVKHGKWLDVRCEVKCSNCGEEYSDEIFLMRGNINYCPNCGAKMDGDKYDYKEDTSMENKQLIIIVGGEVEAEKKKVIDEIVENSDTAFLKIINQEANCHPKKQSLSAENFAKTIAVKKQNAIMTTNSFHFLEAFLFYLQKYGVYENIEFYLVKDGKSSISYASYDIMKNLSQPIYDLADEKFAYEPDSENGKIL